MEPSLRAQRSNLTSEGLLRHPEAGLLAITLLIVLLTSTGCSLLGIHMQVTNPTRAKAYPKFSESTKLLGTLNKYRTCFDVTFYELNIKVDEKNKYLKGSVTMTAKALSDFDTLQIDLYQNMKVNRIVPTYYRNGSTTDVLPVTNDNFYRKYGAVYVKLNKVKAGEIFKLTIDYEGSPIVAPKPPWKGGFVWKKDKDGNPWIGVACETEGASLWWPCKDVTNDEPDSAAINLTVNKDLVGVANGHHIGKEENGNLTTYKWRVSYPINLYDVSIYVGKFVKLEDSYVMPTGKTLTINHYVLPVNYEKARIHLAQAKEQLAFFERTFGEYPWYKDGYKLIESPYEGMEHQTAIAYGAGYKTSYNGFDYIILHESAHEWWGNSITASDLSDVWLQEGFATYSEALFVESTQGQNAYLRYLLTYRLFIKNKRPVVGPMGARFFDFKDSDVYMKGAWILHSLRTLINKDTVFFDILKTFHETYSMKTVTSAEFITMVNEKTGTNYNWFFNQYLHKREAPFLEHSWDGTDFYYRWNYVGPDFTMPAQISLDGLVVLSLKPTASVQKIPVNGKTYKKVAFNNFTTLFGTQENKKLKKIFRQQPQ